MKLKILLVEDDLNLGLVIADHLKLQNYEVVSAEDGAEGLVKFNEGRFNLCILDVMLPVLDGFSLAQDIRKINAEIPILFLTAKSMTEDKIKGFEAGGDDYLTKPFSIQEFELRVKALLRRSRPEFQEEVTNYSIGNYNYNIENQILTFNESEKTLTKKEAQILKILCKHKNQVISREVILKEVWGQDDYFVGRSLDVFITKLRKYFAQDQRIVISNLHGVGFKFEVPE
ncbi:MAG: response regulator transcription factor [Crocinitomicaceae bacterium]|nr:response regulator transcription factor [Crocinitomicaceae bacterium]MDG2506457.1 response regulator transcription factor [Crocinitomicaceae bacterium]